jgi:hypothetical protein
MSTRRRKQQVSSRHFSYGLDLLGETLLHDQAVAVAVIRVDHAIVVLVDSFARPSRSRRKRAHDLHIG